MARDLVVINAAAALYLAGVANDFQNATAMACESIDSGQAAIEAGGADSRDKSELMMATILSEILDRKREVVARLRADPAAQDFRDRALAIRANATPHLLLRALEVELRTESTSSRNLNAGRHRQERSAMICPRPTLPLVTSAVAPVPSRS